MRYIDKKTFIRSHFEQLLARRQQDMLASGPLDKKQIESFQSTVKFWGELGDAGHDGNWTPYEADMVESFKLAGFTLPSDGEERQQLVRDWNQGNKWAAQQILEFSMRLRSFDSQQTLVAPSHGAVKHAPTASSPTLTQVMDEFVKEKQSSWTTATKLSYSRFQSFLLTHAGANTPIRHIDFEIVRKVKNAVADNTRLTNRTRNAYLSFYRSFFKWTTNNGHTERKLFDGIRFGEEKNKAVKLDYSIAQLQKIQKHLLANKDTIEQSRYWCSLVGMYTGARLNEITQIRTQDVLQVDDVWTIRITDDGNDQSLKNKHSKREVPVHPELIELGFLEFLESMPDSGPLFPAQLARARKGSDMSRWFNEQLLRDVGIKSKELDFHSFRRSMNSQLLQEGVSAGVVQAISGHKREGMSETYNPKGYPIKVKLEAICKLRITPAL